MQEGSFEFNEVWYPEGTTLEIAKAIDICHEHNRHVRLFYGNKETGEDWCYDHFNLGYFRRSKTLPRVMLLSKGTQTKKGWMVDSYCLVKILDTKSRDVMYQHPSYHLPELRIDRTEKWYKPLQHSHPFVIIRNDKPLWYHEYQEKAEIALDYLKGNRIVNAK